jgi:hypothetical protein
MKFNQWTLALATAGVVSLSSIAQADEARNPVLTNLSKTTLSGYVDTSANFRFGSAHNDLPGRFNDGHEKQDGFNLNVVKVGLEKPLDDSDWAAGYKVDLFFGPDATGYNPVWSSSSGAEVDDSFSIVQAYVAMRAPVGNGLDLKMGVFNTIIGYEVYESPGNPNFGRSYGWNLEPLQHTGLLASYELNEMVSVAGGIANTLNATVNGRGALSVPGADESQKTYMGAITITIPEDAGFLAGGAIYAGIVDGLDITSGINHDQSNYYAGLTLPTPIERLSVGVAFDYVSDLGGDQDVDAWALAGYASFGLTDKMTLNARADYLQGDDGTLGITIGDDVEMLALTGTLDYQLWDNVISRLELRWDHALEGDNVFGDDDDSALTVALNAIYQF